MIGKVYIGLDQVLAPLVLERNIHPATLYLHPNSYQLSVRLVLRIVYLSCRSLLVGYIVLEEGRASQIDFVELLAQLQGLAGYNIHPLLLHPHPNIDLHYFHLLKYSRFLAYMNLQAYPDNFESK
jgi:hypothetical protein